MTTINPLHYPSLANCKRLGELEFGETDLRMEVIWHNYEFVSICKNTPEICDHYIGLPCPSIAELLDRMPIEVTFFPGNTNGILAIDRYLDGSYCVRYTWTPAETKGTLPDALSLMWVWLKENNYITQ